MGRYDYKELFDKLMQEDTKENRMNLYDWFDRYDTGKWNGECFTCHDGTRLFPVYEHDEELDIYTVIDVAVC